MGGSAVRAVLDSGSGATMISTALAAKLGFNNGERRMISGLSAKAPVRLIHDVDVSLAREPRRLPFAVVADLSAASAAFGRPIDILLGADMFAGSCIALDFGNKRLAVAKSGMFMAGSGWRSVALGRGPKQELFIRASVAGLAPMPLMIDLGSSTALMLSAAYARAQGLLNGKLVSTAALGGVDGVKTNDVFTIPNINIEGLGVSNIPTIGMKDWLPASAVGNIGLPLIAQFDVVFDVTAGFVWLRPLDARHRLPMLKDRSGLGLAASPTALTVVHVAANSPAEKSGWAVGDRIVAVNGHLINTDYTHGELWQWRFGSAGMLVKLETAAGEHRVLRLADYY
ncbi:retropepsin-like aspartic protease [Sphingobium yanoikuyae]|uniref:retropepsin-like aspartic protease n=1 Tax=Sphingobium yanoikuyae TaxID=13690 RepID=UPI00244BDC83|nr:aspartyl protease family protein [Sphingobium yanoikuyae]MDH2151117.1 aspartyl protease family protein [Sphingobium yanoikuyae]